MKIPLQFKAAVLGAVIAASSAQAAAATYKLNVWAPGVRAAVTASPASPSASGGTATGRLEAIDSADFGTVLVGRTVLRNFRFTNTGDGEARNVRAVVSSGDLSISNTSCGSTEAPTAVAPGASCDIAVAFSPSTDAQLSATLAIGGAYSNSPSALGLSGQGASEALGELTANTSTDFGVVAVGGSTTRGFTFRNPGNQAATNVAAQVPQITGLTVSSNTCGTFAAPVTIAGGSSCSIVLNYGGSKASKLDSAPLWVSGMFVDAPAELRLTGSIGNFDATANWTMSSSSVVAPTDAWRDYGTRATDAVGSEKTLYLRNTGATGGIGASFKLVGDTQHFAITYISRLNSAGNSWTGCSSPNGVIAADKLSVSACEAASATEQLTMRVAYAPKSIGKHTINVVPTSSNGTVVPGQLTLTGTGQFNPNAAWSTYYDGVVAPTPATLNYGNRTPGSLQSKTLYVRNVGTHGSMAVAFTVSGDTTQFKITRMTYMNTSSGSEDGSCSILTAQPTEMCLAGSSRQIRLMVEYAPTGQGNHSLTITPSTNNGTVLPTPITLTGAGLFNATGAWSMQYDSLVAPTPAWLSFGTRALNVGVTKVIRLRNTGTNGPLSTAFTVSGDVEHFSISRLVFQRANVSGESGSCAVLDGKTTAYCQAADIQDGGYSQIVVTVLYTPKSPGNHSMTLIPATNNGTALPAPVTFTGTGQ